MSNQIEQHYIVIIVVRLRFSKIYMVTQKFQQKFNFSLFLRSTCCLFSQLFVIISKDIDFISISIAVETFIAFDYFIDYNNSKCYYQHFSSILRMIFLLRTSLLSTPFIMFSTYMNINIINRHIFTFYGIFFQYFCLYYFLVVYLSNIANVFLCLRTFSFKLANSYLTQASTPISIDSIQHNSTLEYKHEINVKHLYN